MKPANRHLLRLLLPVALLAYAADDTAAPAAAAVPLVSHFYYISDDAAFASLERNISAVQLLSPVWFHIQADGKLRNTADDRVRDLAAKAGAVLHPVIVNDDFRLDSARAAFNNPALIEELVNTAVRDHYAGLQLDFENLDAADRDPYAAFAGHLSRALAAKGKTLSIAVVSPVYGTGPATARALAWKPTQRSSAYDYERLAKSASFLTLMTYDQYTSPDAPGPIAGIEWMEACLRNVLDVVPAGKLMLGIPLYHRRWAGTAVTTGTWMEAQELAWKWKTGARLDLLHHEPVIRVRDAGTAHEVWFSNADSVRRRITLARQYGLRGFSAWRLGQEDPSIWTEALATP